MPVRSRLSYPMENPHPVNSKRPVILFERVCGAFLVFVGVFLAAWILVLIYGGIEFSMTGFLIGAVGVLYLLPGFWVHHWGWKIARGQAFAAHNSFFWMLAFCGKREKLLLSNWIAGSQCGLYSHWRSAACCGDYRGDFLYSIAFLNSKRIPYPSKASILKIFHVHSRKLFDSKALEA